jgi:BlaI family transcriptional regulator, penicillinase repressor
VTGVAKLEANDGKAASTSVAPRRSLLDLAPLELDCMNTLWPIGEGTVREIRDRLAPRRPRAYTTIMTIMDRLARKGVVERRKSGRAYVYRPNLSAEEARRQALAQVVTNFFGGSNEAAAAYLGFTTRDAVDLLATQQPVPERAFAAKASAGVGSLPAARAEFAKPGTHSPSAPGVSSAPHDSEPSSDEPERIDETLL